MRKKLLVTAALVLAGAVRGIIAPAGPLVAVQRPSAVDPQLVGTWHVVDVRCPYFPCTAYVVTGELAIRDDASFTWSRFDDFRRVLECRSTWDEAAPAVFLASRCDALRAADEFSHRVVDGRLVFSRGRQEIMTLARGPIESTPSVSAPCLHQDLANYPHPVSPPIVLLRTATEPWNTALTQALGTFHGRGAPLTLQTIDYSDEGDRWDTFLMVSPGHAELIRVWNEGFHQRAHTLVCSLATIRLKAARRDGRWTYVRDARSNSSIASIVFPDPDDRSAPSSF